ncbi:MAG: hypothetical protein P9L92_05400 [Candidatus Electryonea clarkiae]|nr:hypothetical protein [Candidatus Electryonea clarkiae]
MPSRPNSIKTIKIEIHSYPQYDFPSILEEHSSGDSYYLKKKLHRKYFEDYFAAIDVKTIVIEDNYIDRDFLEDYSKYYVKSYSDPLKYCKRIHAFSSSFNEKQFTSALINNDAEFIKQNLVEKYLGFIVLKPLPEAVIGRTCLVPYKKLSDSHSRYYPIIRNYEVNLLGIELTIEGLAFQEQDTVAAACATSALWSAFHYTGISFQHPILSPIEITESVVKHGVAFNERAVPSKGLDLPQLIAAINDVGLEAEVIPVENPTDLKRIAYAYLKGSIPVILGAKLIEKLPGNFRNPTQFDPDMDAHAVTLIGFGVSSKNVIASANVFKTKAENLIRLYAHDDGVGPYSRLVFDDKKVPLSYNADRTARVEVESIGTSWYGKYIREVGQVRFVPQVCIAPVYHKLRLPYKGVEERIKLFNRIYRMASLFLNITSNQDITWDIFLSYGNLLKEEIRKDRGISEDKKKKLLKILFPRFLWIVQAYEGDGKLVTIVYDATSFERCQNVVFVNISSESFQQNIIQMQSNTDVSNFYKQNISANELFEKIGTQFPA